MLHLLLLSLLALSGLIRVGLTGVLLVFLGPRFLGIRRSVSILSSLLTTLEYTCALFATLASVIFGV